MPDNALGVSEDPDMAQFRQNELTRNGLHAVRIDTFGFRKHCELIAAEEAVGEDVVVKVAI